MLTFGEPYEASNGVVVITVTRSGWIERNRPVGIFTVTADGATWTPAVDTGRVALIGVTTGLLAAAFATFAMVRRPPWPDLTEDAMIALAQAKAVSARSRRILPGFRADSFAIGDPDELRP